MTLREVLLILMAVGANPQATLDQAPRDEGIDLASVDDCRWGFEVQKQTIQDLRAMNNALVGELMQKIEGMMLKNEGMMAKIERIDGQITQLVEDNKEQNTGILKALSKPRDCSVLLSLGYDVDGVYTIYPMGEGQGGVEVWCDMTSDGGGWTVFLTRQHQEPPLDFARTWHEYANGFGTASGEYWLGNRYLHALTKDGPQVLKMDITRFDNSSRTWQWSYFTVADAASKFKLTARGFNATTLGNVLDYHNGKKFSTIDQDNDSRPSRTCSELYGRGGWWYGDCYDINPTAPLRTATGNEGDTDEGNTRYWDGSSDRIFTAIRSMKMKLRTGP